MLIAFADPAATVPPSERGEQQTRRRYPLCGKDHRGHRRDQEQHDDPRLREANVGDDRVAEGAVAGRRGVAVRIGRLPERAGVHGQPPRHGGQRDERRPDQHGQRHVEHDGPRPQARPDVHRAGDDLADEQAERERREHDQILRAGRHGARADRDPQHQQEHAGRQDPMHEHRRRRAAEGGDQPAVHQRPIRERQPGRPRADVRADQEQGTGGAGGDQREPSRTHRRPGRARSLLSGSFTTQNESVAT